MRSRICRTFPPTSRCPQTGKALGHRSGSSGRLGSCSPEPFIVINADDYYGKEAYRKLYGWLQQPHAENAIAMAGFVLGNTLSESGGVTRGVCTVREGYVTDVWKPRTLSKLPPAQKPRGGRWTCRAWCP